MVQPPRLTLVVSLRAYPVERSNGTQSPSRVYEAAFTGVHVESITDAGNGSLTAVSVRGQYGTFTLGLM